ncbi:concanavalin A-like lectin/glucanase domain-containing protein [Lipomyces oligophaga]|uniref:concanavalin A-like lectin/glucanase domain-containing protein n=1 Tax=Lipomyces oligophaga TaxID=45792 RepID=UPI0034CEEB14
MIGHRLVSAALSGLVVLLSSSIPVAMGASTRPDLRLSLPSPISPDKFYIPEWEKFGTLRIESDRIFLTSPGERGQNGAVFTKNTNNYETWTTEIKFRASGSDRPGGGMAIWYTASKAAGPVYGAQDYWDGLAIIIDSLNPSQNVRGHLNDGTIGYNTLANPHTQAFAGCPLRYRNTGSIILLRLTVGPKLLKVEVDGRLCFQSEHIALPPNYYFGVSAASFDDPDSFELFGFSTTGSGVGKVQAPSSDPVPQQPNAVPPVRQAQRPPPSNSPSADLHELTSQLVGMQKSLELSLQKIVSLREDIDSLQTLKPLFERLDQKLSRIETSVAKMEAQVHGAAANMHESTKQNIASEITRLTERLDAFDTAIKEHTSSIVGTIPETISAALTKGGPSIYFAIFLLLVIQGGVVVGYVVYKKRREGFHPKYL